MIIRPGATLGGYYIERVLGSGGMGTVYLGRHPTLPRYDALKVLWPHLVDDPEYRARFEREANLAAALDHPNIVSVQNRGEDAGCLWIALQYVNGTDAAAALETAPAGLAPARALRIVTEIGQGLDHAHRAGLLHRDVKPANFLLAPQSHGDERVLLADFGIAKPSGDATELTRTGTFLATVAYASPEQLSGGDLDSRTDVYSLGASFYRLITGQPPFPGTQAMVVMTAHLQKPPPRITALRPDLPLALDDVLARALAKDPADRYGTCLEFTDAAAAALAGAPTGTSETASPPSPRAGSNGSASKGSSAPAQFAELATERAAAQQPAEPPRTGVRPFARLVSADDVHVQPDPDRTMRNPDQTALNSASGDFDPLRTVIRSTQMGFGSAGTGVADAPPPSVSAAPARTRGVRWAWGLGAAILAVAVAITVGTRMSAGNDNAVTEKSPSSVAPAEPTAALASMVLQNPCPLLTPSLRQRFGLAMNASAVNTETERKCSWQTNSDTPAVTIIIGLPDPVLSERFRPNVVVAGSADGARAFAAASTSPRRYPTCSIEWLASFGYVRIAMQDNRTSLTEAELCTSVEDLTDQVYPAIGR
ncbi:serine/threonine-protein kinase [Nocardia sp. NPDC055321]